jgi:hypothetical protein
MTTPGCGNRVIGYIVPAAVEPLLLCERIPTMACDQTVNVKV